MSDLHLFARRSRGTDCVHLLRAELASAAFIVLNGDIFDFRWSTMHDMETTVTAALNWLHDLTNDCPECRVHYILGNHDCLADFRRGLSALAATMPRLQWHEHFLRLGDALFLHGDCADEKMDPPGLRQRRKPWENDRQRGSFATTAYIAADRLGLTRFTQERHFPRRATVERIVHYLDRARPGWQNTTHDCYFGHTHLPFSGYAHNGVSFHNTGSAIRGMDFNPLVFETSAANGETVSTSSRNGQAG